LACNAICHEAFGARLRGFHRESPEERKKAVTYIAAHVENEVEADHFLVVVAALDRYHQATGTTFDPARAESLFRQYLRNLAPVMRELTARMQQETASGGKVAVAVA
jgi:hypothetical protein